MGPLDEIFDLFSNERRRFTLYYLAEADGPVGVDELAQQVEQWESDSSDMGDQAAQYEDVLLTLEHSHLPKIQQVDHVEYDRKNEQIRLSDLATEVDVLLSVSKAIEQPSEPEDVVFGEYS